MAKKEDTHTSAIALQFTEQYGPVGVGPARVARYLERQGLLSTIPATVTSPHKL